jgi:HK97 family phage major capsid protein
MPQMTAAKGVVLGNFSQYIVVEPNINNVMASSDSVRFEYDETVLRLVARFGGTPGFAKRTLADSTTVAAFVVKT